MYADPLAPVHSLFGKSNLRNRIENILKPEKSFSLTRKRNPRDDIGKYDVQTPSVKGSTNEDINNSSSVLSVILSSKYKSNIETDSSLCIDEQIGVISDKVRLIMRHVPQSIAILTTSRKPCSQTITTESDPADLKGIGMTLSSVNTISLEPQPLISFNIKKPSRTLDALMHHGHFLIHFPSCSKAGAYLSDSFSGGFLQSKNLQSPSFCKSTPIPVLNIKGQEISLPALLSPAYPISYILKCEVYAKNGFIDVADHVIVVGKVQKTWSHNEASMQSTPDNTCLGYINGSYCSTGPNFFGKMLM